MSKDKVFGILLTDEGWHELEEPLRPYASEGKIGKYIYCKSIYPDGPYFGFAATCSNSDGDSFEAEIFIPHRYIKFFISAAEKSQIGFIQE